MIAAHVTNSPIRDVLDWSLVMVVQAVQCADCVMPFLNPFASSDGPSSAAKKSAAPSSGEQAKAVFASLGLPIKIGGDA